MNSWIDWMVFISTQTLDHLDWKEMQKMVNICALAPAFILARLDKMDAIKEGAKVLLVTTEGGSITLRTNEEGGGNYGHHASKVKVEIRYRAPKGLGYIFDTFCCIPGCG